MEPGHVVKLEDVNMAFDQAFSKPVIDFFGLSNPGKSYFSSPNQPKKRRLGFLDALFRSRTDQIARCLKDAVFSSGIRYQSGIYLADSS